MSALDRRQFVTGAVLASVSMPLWTTAPASDLKRRPRLGLQLFSIDADMRSDPRRTLHAVNTIGYREVECVGYYGQTTAQLREMLADAGLSCRSIHLRPQQSVDGLPSLEENPDLHMARCSEIGVEYVVCPGPWFPAGTGPSSKLDHLTLNDVVEAAQALTLNDWKQSAELVNSCARRAAAHGLKFAYHNGNMEFVVRGGRIGFECLVDQFDRDLVKLEIDCGWIAAAGYDPLDYLKRLKGRVALAHIKDMQKTAPNTRMDLVPAELGNGLVDFRKLLSALSLAGVELAYVEQEAPYSLPPLEHAQHNFDFLRRQFPRNLG